MTGVRFTAWAGIITLRNRVQSSCGSLPASFPIVTEDLSLREKRPRLEADMQISNAMHRSGEH